MQTGYCLCRDVKFHVCLQLACLSNVTCDIDSIPIYACDVQCDLASQRDVCTISQSCGKHINYVHAKDATHNQSFGYAKNKSRMILLRDGKFN